MVIVLIKIPLLRVEASPVGVSVVVSNLKTRAVLAGKSEPLIVTVVPAVPVAGDRGSRAALAVTVKVVDLVILLTVTDIECVPAVVPPGIVIVLIKIPLLRVEVSPEVTVSVVVSILKTIAVLAAKLEPLTVTTVPAGPAAAANGEGRLASDDT
jgi:hypothetical protein